MTPSAPSLARRLLRHKVVKPAVFVLCLLPLLHLVWRGLSDDLGPNPEQTVIWTTGLWALRLLLLTLAITPLRKLSGWAELARLRRLLGLFAFAYAMLHFTAWFGLVNGFHADMALHDIVRHPFVLAGMTALLLLLPLALTSTNGMIKRLGAARWQRLHRLIYVAGAVAVFHFWWGKLAKNNTATPTAYAAILALLLGLRLWWAWRAARNRRGAGAQGSSRSLA